ncbi:hypothetical protein UA08_01165 [Talaromyces atroroseus]|uniref:Major facilitator superfamily (MFS) profile domain-containing protein n=1 Tax=Talaromyces atroroseus TaxID=1441469 RepID=A0A1Q5QB42_TALAT|nr:hypothetical protein UA08_01165 [Talaromyces atroroseus]OKL63163.1 hypothetical protein UA08_01165 [Talaromyces atroroseus]
MKLDKPSSIALAEARTSEPTLSPVLETQEEESTLEEERFADALEEHSNTDDTDETKENNKRDSKIDDGFAEAPQITEIKEQSVMPDVPVNLEHSQNAEPVTSDPKNNEAPQTQVQTEQDDEDSSSKPVYPSQPALILLIIGLCLAVLLVSLDRTIITTAIPAITNEFKTTSAVGWYGSSYLITACALQPTYGRIYTLFDVKWTFLQSVAIFELGSLICAVAPNSTTLIIGRAIAGWGSAGIITGAFVVVAFAVPLSKRPIYTACIGMMYGAGAAAGPILGGVFTGMVTWRWCPHAHEGYIQRLTQLDIPGTALILISFTMLFLALEYNTTGYAWSSSLVIGLLCGFGVTLLILLAWLWYRQDKAIIVPSIILRRTVGAACLLAFFIYAVLILHGYYLPIWFQAILGTSTEISGVDMLAYVIPNCVFSLMAGLFINYVGYFTPPAIMGCAIATAGAGLVSTLEPTMSTAKWAGFVCLAAAGVGIAVQQSFTAVQSVLRLEQIPIATAAVTCFQSLGGAVFISVGNSILSNELRAASQANELPGIDVAAVLSAGATQFRSTVSPDALPALINVYNTALQKVFIAAIPMAGIAFASTLLMEWRSVKAPAKQIPPLAEPSSSADAPVLPDVDVETRISPVTTRLGFASRSTTTSRGSS